MAGNSLRCALVTLFIFAMVFAPTLSSEAEESPPAPDFNPGGPLCPVCDQCCGPPPPHTTCCKCCASPAPSPTDDQP